MEVYSDEENYIICRGAKNLPTWIWTKDGFNINKIGEIENLIKTYLTENEKDQFTCKKELYDLLINYNFENINKDDYFEMGFLICNKTIKPKECDGEIFLASEEDKKILVKYWYDDNHEMNCNSKLTTEQAEKDVEDFIASKSFFVLKNKNEKIVSMGGYGLTENQARIKHVFTPIEERKKGYAANLIYLMTNSLLNSGYIPLLYTDYNYIPSNKAYINSGYEDKGILINFTCSKI